MGTLSVRENLHFSAALRLPSSTTRQQRRERVEKVITELGLQHCANTKVSVDSVLTPPSHSYSHSDILCRVYSSENLRGE